SGIGAGVHLQDKSPDRSFVILEGREDIGGTWDLFKYPGIRSDSDMHTLGFEFKPWKAEKSIADGPSIMAYLRETVAEHDLKRHMRFGERVVRAEWSTEQATWTVHTQRSDGSHGTFECNFLFMCAGYYSYKSGYLPEFPGREKFRGTIVHPQEWPEDLDYSNKRVVVIGSGATAVTIVPAVAETAAHVTMLQRSPTYMVSRPDTDALANFLRKVLPAQVAYNVTRAKNTWRQQLVYKRTRSNPDQIKM
ncbi:MAG: flavin-containing monooxygenase, partial [Actinomycetota bacterium]